LERERRAGSSTYSKDEKQMGSNLELNKGDQFIFGVDVSASMQTADVNGTSRIEALKEQVITFIGEASKYDPDGVDVITFGQKITHLGALTADQAKDAISKLKANEAMTDTAGLIRKAWTLHQDKASEDQTVLFIATDGEPSDAVAVKDELRAIAKMQTADNEVFSVSFLTVGKISSTLQAFLTELDDTLDAKDKNGNPIDIVDVKALAEVDFLSAFVGAVND
jgi:Mg-chelatase subunit ChlD